MNWASKKICFRFGKDSQYPAYVTGRSVTMSRASVWLQFNFNVPVKLSSYRWYTANDFEERDPATWRLLGSNDGTTWVVLDKVEGFQATSKRNWIAFSRSIK